MIVLYDTNILLDVLQERQPHYDRSSHIWTLAEQKAVEGHVSVISFNNIFYIVRKQVGSAKALDAVMRVRTIFRCVPFDEQLLDEAIADTTGDFEDAIQMAAAARVQANYVVTRNAQDFVGRKVLAVTPEELIAVLKPSA